MGLGNLFLGVKEGCPEKIGCLRPLPPSVPGLDSFKAYLCRPPGGQASCTGLAQDKLFSSLWLSPGRDVHRWVVEVTDTGQLEKITFRWDNSNLPHDFSLWLFDDPRETETNMIDPYVPEHEIDMALVESSTGFLICSRAELVARQRCRQ